MAKQLYWEDVEAGSEITPLPKVATTRMAVKWAGASGDAHPLHYDHSFIASQGIANPIIHGALKRQWLVQQITDWIGEQGTLKKLSVSYRGMDFWRPMKTRDEPEEGETWCCKGKVIKKYSEGDEHRLDCNIWVENGKGEVTVPGTATVVLPSRT